MAKAVVAEAPAAVVADAVAAITADMLAMLGTVGVYAMDLARDHLPSVTYRRPFTTILASVLIIATILPVSTTPVFPSLRSRHRIAKR